MLYTTLLLCVSSALASYTIGPENRLTTQSTTTESIKFFSAVKLVRGGPVPNRRTQEYNLPLGALTVSRSKMAD